MNKTYTTIEQAKELVEAGLNPETSDMHYNEYIIDGKSTIDEYPQININSTKIVEFKHPCWSTDALLNLMPPYLFEFSRGIDLNIYKNLNDKKWIISYLPNNIESMQKDKFRQFCFGNTLLEAAYDMVLWLLKEGYINKTELSPLVL